MPIFEYRCSSCDEQFEELVLSRSQSAVECPRCGGTKVTPLVSRFAARTGGNAFPMGGDCASRAAGICEAGGGALA
jgi:putative FmdB family regulatory protein